ncbi:MAG: UDP-3-O-acyl-N-acetylglucosamine deacetylase [Deltaproteobacteria bacterium]|nr:UDP-3-O-acyl-N-acetylglucosamine deacetylase [Deltaproteobacteria bacterium]
MDTWQHTIKKTVSFAGIGLHSGNTVKLYIKPAGPNTGIRFVRTDLHQDVMIPATLYRVSDTRLATTLAKDDVKVSTTEHLLAALAGMGIDNVVVELDNDEVPIMDGSAAPFVHVLRKAGRLRQKSARVLLRITRRIEVKNGDSVVAIEPHDGFKVSGEIDFDHHLVRKQRFAVEVDPETFMKEIASARTFGFLHEVEFLRRNGKALGGSLDNAIVIDRSEILNAEGLRFADEFVRHKLLDLIGDLALLGCPVLGHITATKAGHAQHLQLMREIADHPECWQLVKWADNGEEGVLEKVVMTTRAAGNKILPYLVPPQVMPAANGAPLPA